MIQFETNGLIAKAILIIAIIVRGLLKLIDINMVTVKIQIKMTASHFIDSLTNIGLFKSNKTYKWFIN